MGCNECTHPSCQHSLNSLGIGQCVECDSGVLVLDPTSGPKWRMACNKCNVVVHFFEHAHKVQVRKWSYILCYVKIILFIYMVIYMAQMSHTDDEKTSFGQSSL